MFKSIVLLSALALASVVCDLKDFPDRDAFILAQFHNLSLLEPPKQLYDQIVKELAAVRKLKPEVSDIHHNPTIELGKVICYNVDLQKLNDSKELGPIKVEGIGHKIFDYEEVMITFTKPFNELVLAQKIDKEFPGKRDINGTLMVGCGSVNKWGAKTQIHRGLWPSNDAKDPLEDWNISYYIVQALDSCFEPVVFQCQNKKEWMFEIDTKLFKKTGEIKVTEIDLNSDKSTTPKF